MKKQSYLRQLVKEEIANMISTNNRWKTTAMNIVETILNDNLTQGGVGSTEDSFISGDSISVVADEIIFTLEQKGYLRDMGDNSSPFGENLNPIDSIKLDIPLFIRLLEYAREDANSDIDLHDIAELATSLSKEGKILNMEDYPKLIQQPIENINESNSETLGIYVVVDKEDPGNEIYIKGEEWVIKNWLWDKMEDNGIGGFYMYDINDYNKMGFGEINENELDDDMIDKQASNSAKNDKQYSTVNKAIKGLKQLEKEMKELAVKYKTAEDKEKESIKNQLKDKTTQKKKIEAYIDKQTLEDDED